MMKPLFLLFAIMLKVVNPFYHPRNILLEPNIFQRNTNQRSLFLGLQQRCNYASNELKRRIQACTNLNAEKEKDQSRKRHKNEKKDTTNLDLDKKSSLFFYQTLIDEFQGDFDNFFQIEQNKKAKLYPGEGGGHEHIHATILPLSEQTCARIVDEWDKLCQSSTKNENPYKDLSIDDANIIPHFVLACYYMDGIPSKIFRFRLYSFEPTLIGTKMEKTNSKANNAYINNMNVLLKIYTVDPNFISMIKENVVDQPTQWENQFWNFLSKRQIMNSTDEKVADALNQECKSFVFELLEGCNVLWTPTIDPKRHSYIFDDPNISLKKEDCNHNVMMDNSFHAIMLNETGAVVNSMMIPGKKIRIQDELSLWFGESSEYSSIPSAALWINDRGFDLDTGEFIYGNRVGVPYKMDRVASFESNPNFKAGVDNHITPWRRVIVQKGLGTELKWTLDGTGNES